MSRLLRSTYYVNASGTTQWDFPQIAAPPPQLTVNAATLPPGWVSQVDPSSGNVFYANTATGHVQWVPPEPAGEMKPAPQHAPAPMMTAAPPMATMQPGVMMQQSVMMQPTVVVLPPATQASTTQQIIVCVCAYIDHHARAYTHTHACARTNMHARTQDAILLGAAWLTFLVGMCINK